MPETYTEVTSRSWFSRLGGAFKGIFFGLILIGIAVWILFANEGRAVRRSKALAEGASTVVSVSPERIDASHEGRLVHVSGLATTEDLLRDEIFGIAEEAIHLHRDVEMYQWLERQSSETEKKLGGGTETTTTYSYEKGWSSSLAKSGSFKVPEGHENPTSLPYTQRKITASEVTLGAFRLSPGLIDSMTRSEPLPVESLKGLEGDLRWTAKLHDSGLYIGRSPASPEVGDLRVTFSVVRPAEVSVVAGQSGDLLTAKTMSNGGSIQLLRYGTVPADEMFESAKQSNRMLTWFLRLVGLVVMALGFKRIFRPFSVTADLVPIAGNLVERLTDSAAYLLAAGASSLVIAIAWLYHRPLLAVTLLLVAGAAFAVASILTAKALERRRMAGATPPPPSPEMTPKP